MPATTAVHVFVELDKNSKIKIEFDVAEVTGAEIKSKAGVPADNDLARRSGGKLELITNEEIVPLKNGDQFVVFPPGTIS